MHHAQRAHDEEGARARGAEVCCEGDRLEGLWRSQLGVHRGEEDVYAPCRVPSRPLQKGKKNQYTNETREKRKRDA
jgi:hypothetical protein